MTKKIISIDVGIKNLAYCIIEKNESNFKIIDWDIINILDQKIEALPKCIHYYRKKICGKPARFIIPNKDENDTNKLAFCDKKTCETFMKTSYPNIKPKKIKKVNTKTTSLLELASILINKYPL